MPAMRTPRVIPLLCLPVLALLSTAAQAQLQTIAVGTRPESVTRGWDGKLFVSIQGTPDPGDGEIRQLDLEAGTVIPFVSGLNNPRGLAFTGQFLVVTDTTQVWIIDASGGKRVLAEAAAFPHPIEFLNDAAAERGGRSVLVTEMGARSQIRDPASGFLWPLDTFSAPAWAIEVRSRIYRISIAGEVEEVVPPSRNLLTINGVALANGKKRLLAVDFFSGNIVALELGKRIGRTIVASGFRGGDGIEQDSDGDIYVSSFENGAVWKLDAAGERVNVLLEGVGRQSTADFYLDDPGDRLLVPDTLHGTVIVLPTE
jgi:sugar lactone lactonase YvrE